LIVLDASVIVEVLIRTPASPAIERRGFDPPEALHAPHPIDVEVAPELRRFVLGGRLNAMVGRTLLEALVDFQVERYDHRDLVLKGWALRENVTACDGVCVALAEPLDATLVARFRRQANAATRPARVEIV
jgi:predicted nucleic acid-binding protein